MPTLALLVIQTLLILVAPVLFAASIYMFLARIIAATGLASYSLIRPTRISKVFVGGDVICFLVQAVGAAAVTNAKNEKASDRGQKIILFGLFLQVALFGFFGVVAGVFHRRVKGKGLRMAQESGGFAEKKYMHMLYAVSAIITVRNVFRMVEYAMGGESFRNHVNVLEANQAV